VLPNAVAPQTWWFHGTEQGARLLSAGDETMPIVLPIVLTGRKRRGTSGAWRFVTGLRATRFFMKKPKFR